MISPRFLLRVAVAAAVASAALLIPGLPGLVAAALAGLLFLGVASSSGWSRKRCMKRSSCDA